MTGKLGCLKESKNTNISTGETVAGAPGIEPGITGSKPVALPLGYAPIGGRHT